jgi:pimeloyl-ACP methyl ester carboxylesterase
MVGVSPCRSAADYTAIAFEIIKQNLEDGRAVLFSALMRRQPNRGLERSSGRRSGTRLAKGLLLAGAAVGLPVLISEVIRRRAEPPQTPRWGRAHRYAGALGEVVFQELGAGTPPLLLLHSLGPGYDANQWRAAAELLAERHAVYVPDLPGWGRSEPPSGGLRAEACVTMIEDFLHGVVREPAVLVAAGISAAYAVRVAAARPDRVLALVLVTPLGLSADGGAAADGAGPAFLRQLLQMPVLRTTLLDLLTSRSALTHHLRKEVYAAPERVDAALLDHHYRASHTPRARAALGAYLRGDLGLEVGDVESDLEKLEVPVLVAWGRTASSSPVENADLWLHRLPHAGLEVFQGSGDLPHIEGATLFCRAVERFLDGI